MNNSWIILFLGIILSCSGQSRNSDESVEITIEEVSQKTFNPTVIQDIPIPDGFVRRDDPSGSLAAFLRELPLDTLDQIVHLFNGEEKYNQDVHYAIVDMDVGSRDLQQCADAVMRLYAEYQFANGLEEDITFDFTSGDEVPFSKYAEGFRPSVNGSTVSWHKTRSADHSYANFRKYMDLIFTYAGSYSLSQELKRVPDIHDIAPGDVLIQGGFPGHAVTVVDVIQDQSSGEKLFLLVQSYMPAQEIHVLKNPVNDDLSPWYAIPSGETIKTPEWTFLKENLMRFDRP